MVLKGAARSRRLITRRTALGSGAPRRARCRALAGVVAVCLGALAVGAGGAEAFVALPGTFTQVSAGEDEACAVRTSGALVCWDEFGNIFLAPAGTYEQVSLSSFTNVSPGPSFKACAVRSDQTLVCFGQPFADPTPAGTFLAVDTSFQKACALRTDQTLVCWGDSLGSFPDLTPTPLGTFTAVAVSAVFPPHACALAAAQTITCWGNVVPTPLPGTFTALDAANFAECAIRTDGTLACSAGATSPPAGTFTSLSMTFNHGCAVRTDSTVACWGNNAFGQATPPPGAFTQVATGEFVTCGGAAPPAARLWGRGPRPARGPGAPGRARRHGRRRPAHPRDER